MIQIIKNGDPRKTDNFMQFQCDNCGCIWKADHLDYKEQPIDWDTLYTAHCPNCHEEAWVLKDGWNGREYSRNQGIRTNHKRK